MPNYYPYQYYPAQAQYPQIVPPTTQPTQANGFISVRNELEARNYPVAIGNSVTFKDENAPYIYTKTMGFSQLDRPSFEKYKLVKEEVEDSQEVASDLIKGSDVDEIKAEIEKLWGEIDEIKSHDKSTNTQTRRKKDGDD